MILCCVVVCCSIVVHLCAKHRPKKLDLLILYHSGLKMSPLKRQMSSRCRVLEVDINLLCIFTRGN